MAVEMRDGQWSSMNEWQWTDWCNSYHEQNDHSEANAKCELDEASNEGSCFSTSSLTRLSRNAVADAPSTLVLP